MITVVLRNIKMLKVYSFLVVMIIDLIYGLNDN